MQVPHIFQTRLALASITALALGVAAAPASASRIDGPGHVFTSTNDAAGNAVLVYERGLVGTLQLVLTAPTGGNGTGAGLGSQGALAFSTDHKYLFVVNAGSNSLSTFLLSSKGMQLMSTVASGGTAPISVAERSGTVYVLHSGVGAKLVGFQNVEGQLTPLADGVRTLSDDTIDVGPAEVSFDPLGRTVMVTEKNTSQIDTWRAAPDGTLGAILVTPSAGATPFGFVFDPAGHAIVSEAKGGADGSGASSYRFAGKAPQTPVVVTASLGTGQAAACWSAATPDGHWAFTANAGSGSISSFAIDGKGALTLAQAQAEVVDGSHPIDMAVSPTGRRLFVLNTGSGNIASFALGGQGRLQPLSSVDVPLTAAGLLTR